MARFPAQRRGAALVPTTQEGRDAVNSLQHGAGVMVSISQPINVRQFRLFWKLCQEVAEHYDVTKEAIKDDLCIAVRHCDVQFQRDGSFKLVPKSIAVETWKERRFDEFFQLCVNKVCEWMGTEPREVREHILSLIDSPQLAPRMRTRQTEPVS